MPVLANALAQASLVTYLLEKLTLDDISRVSENSVFFEANPSTGHGLLVSAQVPGGCTIARQLPGDNSDIVRSWLDGTAVELLVQEYRRRTPSDEEKESALDTWKRAHAELEELRGRAARLAQERKRVLLEIDRASQVEEEACRDLVRTHGRTRIWLDGVQWEVTQKVNRVYYRRCRTLMKGSGQ